MRRQQASPLPPAAPGEPPPGPPLTGPWREVGEARFHEAAANHQAPRGSMISLIYSRSPERIAARPLVWPPSRQPQQRAAQTERKHSQKPPPSGHHQGIDQGQHHGRRQQEVAVAAPARPRGSRRWRWWQHAQRARYGHGKNPARAQYAVLQNSASTAGSQLISWGPAISRSAAAGC